MLDLEFFLRSDRSDRESGHRQEAQQERLHLQTPKQHSHTRHYTSIHLESHLNFFSDSPKHIFKMATDLWYVLRARRSDNGDEAKRATWSYQEPSRASEPIVEGREANGGRLQSLT